MLKRVLSPSRQAVGVLLVAWLAGAAPPLLAAHGDGRSVNEKKAPSRTNAKPAQASASKAKPVPERQKTAAQPASRKPDAVERGRVAVAERRATEKEQKAWREAREARRRAEQERARVEAENRRIEAERKRIEAEKLQARSELNTRQGDLGDLRGRLQALKDDIARHERLKATTADRLESTEEAISTTRRQLYQLGEEKTVLEGQIRRLQQESAQLNRRIELGQLQVGELLRRQYMSGGQEGTRHLLSSQDFNQLARDSHYLSRLSQAQAGQIDSLRQDLAERDQLLERARQARERLKNLASEQDEAHARLVQEQKRHQSELQTVAEKLRQEKRQVDTLRDDEARLGKLIVGLGKILAKPVPKPEPLPALPPLPPEPKLRSEPPPRAVAPAVRPGEKTVVSREERSKPEVAPRVDVPARPQAAPAVTARKPAEEAPRREPVVARSEQDATATPTGLGFAQLRGRVHLPVRGELLGRFGAPRAEGGMTWKGVFIRAASGGDVRAVAGGRVAFADWLRGFGNLIIVDHGDGYLTIYGNNEALLKSPGEPVRTGESIARVGHSGGSSEHGVYFEIRHQGQPQDPLKWVAR